MKNQIIVHAANNQTRIALIEKGELAQLFIESPENQRTVGDIYLAEVHKVMAGIRAAFIDLGTPRDAFLHFSDTGEYLEDYIVMLNGKKALPRNYESIKAKQEASDNEEGNTPSISELQNRSGALLQQKQKLLVQIVKEPIGSKGPRVSTNISIAGRFLVLMPMGDYVGVSKRIRSHKERRRLRQVVSDILPEGFGVIIRTVADGQNEVALQEDLKDVLTKWEAIVSKLETAKPPQLLHRDLDMTESLVRDLFAKDYDRVLIDDYKLYKSIKSYISRVAPAMVPNIHHYKGSEHIFDYMKIGKDVDSVFSPKVKMPSGGYLIFEQTEAMYVVDVNSGRYAAKKNQEDNSLKTNLEAAREIAKQLRLRDIGGIIVVDFIDLWDDNNRKKIFDELKKEFRKDRAKTNLLAMSDFGLVQITRQRIRPSVVNAVSKVCPNCGGSGTIVSQSTIIADIESWLTKLRYTYKYRSVDLHVNPYLHSMLCSGLISKRVKWMFKRMMYISILPDETISLNDFNCTLPGTDIDITEAVMNDLSIEEVIKQSEESIANLPPEKKTGQDLDVYKRDQPESRTKSRSSRETAKDSKGGQEDSKPSKSRPAPSRRTAPKPKAKAKEVETDKGKEQKKTESAKKSRVGAKYYKNDKQDDAPVSGKAKASEKDKVAETEVTPQPDNAQKKPPVETPDQPTEKPRSALEVAREHRLKKEKEEAEARKKDSDDSVKAEPVKDSQIDSEKHETAKEETEVATRDNGQVKEDTGSVQINAEEVGKKGSESTIEDDKTTDTKPAKGKVKAATRKGTPRKTVAKTVKGAKTAKASKSSKTLADNKSEKVVEAVVEPKTVKGEKARAKPKPAKRPRPATRKKTDSKAIEKNDDKVENLESSTTSKS